MLPGQPSDCTISITQLNNQALSQGGVSLPVVEDEVCDMDDLVLTLPSKSAPWRIVTPTGTVGTVGDMTAEGRRFLLNRGGRKRWARVSEFDTSSAGTVVDEVRFDEGIDYGLKTGDTLSGVRCSYDLDWSTQSSMFVGQIKAVWTVTIDTLVLTFVKVYDVVRQILFCPASWSDVLSLRPELDNEISQVMDKERIVIQAWQDIITNLDKAGVRHNLIIPDGSTVLRDAVVHQVIINLTQYHGLMTPQGYIGQTDNYVEMLEERRNRILGDLRMPVDNNEDGILSHREQFDPKRQHWFKSKRRSVYTSGAR